MKKNIYAVIFILFLLTFPAFSQTENKELIKRKIIIFPFYNENDIKEYNYLENTIRDALRAKLQTKEMFLFANFNEIDEKIKNIQHKDLVYNDDTIIKTALKLGADVVLTGKYIVIKDKIMIIANSIDVLQKQSVISATVSGDTGVEIFSLIDNMALTMSDKISQNFPKLEKSILEQLVEKQQKEHNVTVEEEKKASDKTKEKEKSNSEEAAKNSPDYKKFSGSLGAGIGLTSAGLLCALIGSIPLAVGLSMNNLFDVSTAGSLLTDSTNAAIIVGTVFLGAGGVMLVVGIIMYPIAGHFYKKWKASAASEINIKPVLEFKNNIYSLGFAIKI